AKGERPARDGDTGLLRRAHRQGRMPGRNSAAAGWSSEGARAPYRCGPLSAHVQSIPSTRPSGVQGRLCAHAVVGWRHCSQEFFMSAFRVLGGAVLGLAASVALAADPDQAIRPSLTKLQPDMPIEAIAESPMSGLYQVHLKGGRLLYTSADGQFVLQGNLYQVKGDNAVNLTRQSESKGVAKEINSIPASEMVVF